MKIVELVQGSAEWLQWRRDGLGGSDAPVVVGLSPYRTARQLFFEKRGITVPGMDEGNEYIFAQGHKVEALIRNEFYDLTGVRMQPICVEHREIKHLRASLDGFDEKLGVLEAKLVGKDALEAARNGKMPEDHFIQMQHQFAATGVDRGQWFGHDGKKSGILIDVKADAAYIAKLLRAEEAFWKIVQEGIVPPLSDRDDFIPEDLALMQQLREAKEHADNAKLLYEQLKDKTIATYNHPRIAGAGVRVTKVNRSGSIEYKNLPEVKALAPEYLEQFRGKNVESWMVTIEKSKEKK